MTDLGEPDLFFRQDIDQRISIDKLQFLNKSFPHHNFSQRSWDSPAPNLSHFSTPQCILELDMVSILHHCIRDSPDMPWAMASYRALPLSLYVKTSGSEIPELDLIPRIIALGGFSHMI